MRKKKWRMKKKKNLKKSRRVVRVAAKKSLKSRGALEQIRAILLLLVNVHDVAIAKPRRIAVAIATMSTTIERIPPVTAKRAILLLQVNVHEVAIGIPKRTTIAIATMSTVIKRIIAMIAKRSHPLRRELVEGPDVASNRLPKESRKPLRKIQVPLRLRLE